MLPELDDLTTMMTRFIANSPTPRRNTSMLRELSARLRARLPRIPGSKYHRVRCSRCGSAMRASTSACAKMLAGTLQLLCERCAPPIPTPKAMYLTPRQRAKLDKTSS